MPIDLGLALGGRVKTIYSKKNIVLGLTVLASLQILVFQNCSKSQFSQAPSVPENPIVNPACLTDQELDPATNSCIDFVCKSYSELSSNVLRVPNRDFKTGVCYYKKVLDKSPASEISTTGNYPRESKVIASNHNKFFLQQASEPDNVSPYDIGGGVKSFQITSDGARSMKILGGEIVNNIFQPVNFSIDNFLLVRMNNDNYIRAFGSADIAINSFTTLPKENFVKYQNKNINIVALANSNFLVKPIDITGQFQVGKQFDLNIHALDCGGARFILGDLYLLFQ